jgi:hypothetical protein
MNSTAIAQLINAKSILVAYEYTSAASATLYVYDIFLTFDDEVRNSFLAIFLAKIG